MDRPRPYLRVHGVKVFVRDQERSLRFYLDQLGFDLAFHTLLQSDERAIAVSSHDGGAVLTLVAPKPASKEYKLIGRSTGIVLVTEDVLAKFDEWRKRGVHFLNTPRLRRVSLERRNPAERSPVPASAPGAPPWGGVFTRFCDPDGNTFELVGFDEVTREIEARRRANAEKLEAERRAAQELEIARQVQARLFPQNLPPIETLQYAGICIQARQVGGDYYDFLNLGQQRYGLVIGDIAGKGIAAALLMANLQANLRSQCAIALDQPRRFMQSVNRLLHQNSIESAYATLFFAEYDDRGRTLRYINCGHLSGLLLRRDGGVERLDSTATVLGLFEDWDCVTGQCRLRDGDVLALYTDGVTEACNDAGEEFGEQRLVKALQRGRELRAGALVSAVVDEVRHFGGGEQQDDITVIVAQVQPACVEADRAREAGEQHLQRTLPVGA